MKQRESTRRTGAARRAIGRWAFRLFVRERRQQVLIVSVIAVAVAAAVFGVAAVYNTPSTSAARFGTAQQRFDVVSTDTTELATRLADARRTLGTIEVIGRLTVPIPGSVDTVDARIQDPKGVYASETVRLRNGRLPEAAPEIAVTANVAQMFDVRIGRTITIAGKPRTVTGIIENPYDLTDDFILVPPAANDTVHTATVFADATSAQLQAFRESPGRLAVGLRGSDVNVTSAASMFATSTVVFLLVTFVAAAAFAVVAQRRQRQLGMLAAVGANDRHLKLVLVAHGVIVGVIASTVGTAIGLVGWFVTAHRLETGAGHRIDALHVPWPFVFGATIAGVVVPIIAAWWPTRSMQRRSIVDAISARPPQPRRADASIALASVFLVAGVVLLSRSHQTRAAWLVTGVVATVVGILLVCPSAIRLLARCARRAPATIRIALRDIGRYQARAGAALAAISLALGVPLAIVLVASAADHAAAESAGKGNLAATQLVIRIDQPGDDARPDHPAPNLDTAQLAAVQSAVDALASSFGHAAVVPLQMPVESSVAADARTLIDLGESVNGSDHRYRAVSTYVATPELLSFLGVDASSAPAGTDVLTTHPSAPIIPLGKHVENPSNSVVAPPQYSSLPSAFITQSGLAKYDLEPALVGWIIESPQPLTTTQIANARQIAIRSGFTLESRHGRASRATIRNTATAAGALFALTIVAMTVGTIRSESAGELRTLTATGANSSIRRALTAATAASLALAGVVLGLVGAYLGLIGASAHHLDRLGSIPFANLLTALVGVPLLSCGVGWCLGGREPAAFARSAGN